MKNKIWILYLIFSTTLYSQTLELLNKKFEIPNILENDYECRVYIFEALTRNVNLYRIYNSYGWKTDRYKYNTSEFENIQYYTEPEIESIEPAVEQLSINHKLEIAEIKGLDKYWQKIIDSSILEVPNYKNTFFEKTVKEYKDGKVIYRKVPFPPPTDGYYYIIQIKNNNQQNHTEINNPKYYISNISENESLKSLNTFLFLIEEIFNIQN